MTEKERREKEFEDEFANKYVRKHAAVAKSLSGDYKRNAINKALVEMYCSGDKYPNKNKALKEKSRPGNAEWVQLRDKHRETVENHLTEIRSLGLPDSVEESISDIAKHYERYLDVVDVDLAAKL